MKNVYTKIALFIVSLVVIFSLASCNKTKDFKYPAYNELSAAPSEAFVTIGNYKLSNKDLYYYLLNNYGVEVLGSIVDNKLMPELTSEQEQDFNDFLNEAIYGTSKVDKLSAEEKADKEDAFMVQCHAYGLNTNDESNPNHYKNYYRLDYKRYLGALASYKADIEKADKEADEDEDETTTAHFAESDYVDYLENSFGRNVKAYYCIFNTYNEALALLEAAGINTKDLNSDWAKDAKTVINGFGGQEANLQDLYAVKVNGSVTGAMGTKALSMQAGEYTHAPQSFGNAWYLLFVESVESDFDVNGTKYADNDENFEHDSEGNITKVLNENLKAELFDLMVANELLANKNYDSYLDKYAFELRQQNDLKIYYEGLEIKYKKAFETIYTTLSITNYESFKETTEENTQFVATWKDGSLTADELYDALVVRYGALTTFLLVRQSVLFDEKYNKVVDFGTHEIKDQKAYDKLKADEITAVKDAFEAGNFASSGYPVSYGWENFLRDYVGQLAEENIIFDFDSDLSEQCLALYKKALYIINDASEVKASVNGNEVTLSSDKWAESHKVVLADLKVGATDADVKVQIVTTEEAAKATTNFAGKESIDKNEWYYHLAIEYPNTAGTKVTTITEYAVDTAVMEEYKNLVDNSFSVVASGLQAFFDADHDGEPDETANYSLLEEFAGDVFNKVEEIFMSVAPEDQMLAIINNLFRADKFYTYLDEAANLVLSKPRFIGKNINYTIVKAQTYTEKTELNEAWSKGIANMISSVQKYIEDERKSPSIIGAELDLVYRYEYNDEAEYITAVQFQNSFKDENTCVMLYPSKISAKTDSGYEEGKEALLPSYYYYEQSQTSSPEVTIKCTAQLSAYYNPAINALSSDTVTNEVIVKDCQKAMESITFANTSIKSEVAYLFQEALKNYQKTTK